MKRNGEKKAFEKVVVESVDELRANILKQIKVDKGRNKDLAEYFFRIYLNINNADKFCRYIAAREEKRMEAIRKGVQERLDLLLHYALLGEALEKRTYALKKAASKVRTR